MKFSACFLFAAAAIFAQDNPLSSGMNMMYNMSKANIIKSAEKMPEDDYGFKPVDSVRSFGQLVGHVAGAQYLFCSPVLGEQMTPPGIEKSATTKAALVEALKTAFAYCDKAYASMTDAHAADKIKFFGQDSTKLGTLSFNNMHNYEHYGNMVTYLRMKGLVPPSSEGGPMPKKK